MIKEINELLKDVNKLFPVNRGVPDCYSFTIGRFQRGFWCFNVVDNWHNWFGGKLKVHFTGDTPQEAIKNFLQYVDDKKINIKKLSGGE